MNGYRIVSMFSFGVGAVFLMSGFQQMGQAATCEEAVRYSQKCIGAHQIGPKQNASTPYCEWENNECIKPATGSGCNNKYGSGIAGECDPLVVGTDEVFDCYEDSHETFVLIPYYSASCVQNNAECNCVWTQVTSPGPLPMQLCDCYDVEVEY